MPPLRDSMEKELKLVVVPKLRGAGFSGSFPHFRRATARGIDLLTFQFDRNGGGFVIEIARGPLQGITTSWGKVVGPKQLTAWDLHLDKRLRLKPTATAGGTDTWFRYDAGQYEECGRSVLKALTQAEEW